jgi:hypothetical protein
VPRRPSLFPALVAVAATLAAGLGGSLLGAPADARTTAQTAAATEPLQVEIESLSPSYVPDQGTVTLTGTVTNVSTDRWRSIRVYAFMDDTPMRSTAELEAAVDTPAEAVVGNRILLPGTFDQVGRLAPGESAAYSITLRRNQLPAQEAGVYWFGAHALGTDSADAPDTFADGRARTFLSLVPPSTRGTVRTSIVIPVRRAIRHAPDGRIRTEERWATDLDDDGRLRSLIELGAAAGATPVTWLVDPAVPDAVARLVAGNLPRTLADNLPPPGEETEPPEPDPESPSGSGDAEPTDPAEPDPDAPTNPATEPGRDWLDRFGAAIAADEVLALPYGDPDVAAEAAHAPDFYDEALNRLGAELQRLEITTSPAVGGPEGYFPPAALYLLAGDETVIMSDAALSLDDPVTSARIEGRRVLFSSSAVAQGGPAPGNPLSEIALRQRLLAEAAVRLLFHDRTPLLVVLPETWRPDSPASFWSGLDPDWLELTDTADLGRGRPLNADEVAYPVEQELTELDAENFEAAELLIEAGRQLDTVLPRNDRLASLVLDEALTSLSYTERDRALASRRDTMGAVEWIQKRLSGIRVRAPRGVTLSSSSGTLGTVVVNRLHHSVTVRLSSESLGAVTVEPSPVLELAPRSRQTVTLKASASSSGVHYVRVQVTDADGHPLGASQRVAIRSADVSRVIWLILGLGVGLLFVAIAIRVVRRVRSERA